VKTIIAAAALALTATAFLAQPVMAATMVTYQLNVDNCSNTCGQASYGHIDVSNDGLGTLTVDIELNANTIFQEAGGKTHNDVWFDTNTSSVTIGGLVSPFSANGVQAAGSNAANGSSFGNYDYVIKRTGNGNPATALDGQHSLIFTVSGPNSLALDHTTVDGTDLFFVVDVASFQPNGGALINTGRIGASIQGGVPEPASWALMILGFGGVGAVLRTRRRPALAAAA
jgi:hypothetical protein